MLDLRRGVLDLLTDVLHGSLGLVALALVLELLIADGLADRLFELALDVLRLVRRGVLTGTDLGLGIGREKRPEERRIRVVSAA